MSRYVIAIAISAAMVGGGVAYAQKGHGAKGGKTNVTPGAKAHGGGAGHSTTQGAKAHGPKSTTTRGPKTTTTTTTTKAHGGGKKSTSTTTTTTTTAAAKGNKKTTTTTTSTSTSLTLTPVQQKLQRNTNLASKLEGRLPAGTNLLTAAEGFHNLGQFVAAVNVSHNLDIPFETLKTRMVDDGLSLGQAIQAERKSVDVTTEVRRAEADANQIIAEADRTVTSPKTKKKDGGN